MNRRLFLKRLYNSLKWDLSLGEAQDIVSDYDEYFDEGLSLGKTESQLCAEFGAPKQIAANILSERGTMIRFMPGAFRKSAAVLLALFYPILFLWRELYYLLSTELIWLKYLYVAAAPLLIIFCTGAWPLANRPARASRRESLLCGGLSLFLLLLAAVCSFLVYDFLAGMLASYPNDNGKSVYFVFYVCEYSVYIVAAMWLAVILAMSFKNAYSSCVHFLFACFLSVFFNYISVFSSMNFEEQFTRDLIMKITFLPCTELLAAVALYSAAWCAFVRLRCGKSVKP